MVTFTPTVPTVITLTVTDDNCPKAVTYKISIKPIPTITTIEEKRHASGQHSTLTSAAGDPKTSISWYDDPSEPHLSK
ncbi:MAG: hypothetical protein IPM69_05680 [Ignavibacteria bacterium]|nr:hypothetical protein [Ignavibacteria bacterium]